MLSGGEYLINDIFDRERDQKHPVKSQRPIASGQLKVSHAFLLASLLIVLALVGTYLTVNLNFLIISASYVLLVLLYTFIFKHLVIVDILVVSSGFVIRAVAGCLAINVFISPWLIICTFLLALFLALEKRWHELVILSDDAETHRPTFSEYSTKMLEQLIGIITGVTIVSYLMYTTLAGNYAMVVTAPFAIYGLFRYLYLVHQKGLSAEPETVLKDKAILINLGVWGLLVISIILYGVLV
jgi:4-hydroxybenzoate polyprenyltransferase